MKKVSKNYRNNANKMRALKIRKNEMVRVVDYDETLYCEYVVESTKYEKWNKAIEMIADRIKESMYFTTYGTEIFMRDNNRSIYTGWIHCDGWMPHYEFEFASVQLCNKAWNEANRIAYGYSN